MLFQIDVSSSIEHRFNFDVTIELTSLTESRVSTCSIRLLHFVLLFELLPL
jgi:hypothetical protein